MMMEQLKKIEHFKKHTMKRLLIFLGLIISVTAFSQREVFQEGMTPEQFRSAGNTVLNNHTDSLQAAIDSIAMLQDSNYVHRGLIDLNYGWIYDIMNDSLPDHWSVILDLKYDSIPALRTAIESIEPGSGDSSWTSINLIPTSSPPSSNEGDIYYAADNNLLLLHNGVDWDTLNVAGTGGGASYDTTYLYSKLDSIVGILNDSVYRTSNGESITTLAGDGIVWDEVNEELDWDSTTVYNELDGKEDLLVNEAGLYAALSDVAQFYSAGDEASIAAAIGEGELANDIILEQDLKAVNSPTDEYVLTYEATTGDFEWQVDQTGGSINVSDSAIVLTDPTMFAVFGAGVGLAADTVLFDTIADGSGVKYGEFYVESDSVELLYFKSSLSAGDTLDVILYMNDSLHVTAGATVIDTLHLGEYETVTTNTGFSTTTIAKGNYVWGEFLNTVDGRNPVYFRSRPVGYIKRD